MSNKLKTNSKDKDVKATHVHLKADNRYPLVPLLQIQLVERPMDEETSSQVFYNPRSLESFTPETMNQLKADIAEQGLRSPLVVRVFTSDKTKQGDIERIELVAGERRLRCCLALYEENVLVRDVDGEMRPAGQVLEKIPCTVLYNISDEESLQEAWTENNDHQSISTKEEIAVVERLARLGLKQDEIAKTLRTNVTWVSQTCNFRKELPKDAFSKLLKGSITRHVAVQLLSFVPEDREALFQEAVRIEAEQTAKQLEEATLAVEEAEDQELIQETREKKAIAAGDEKTAKRATKKKAAASKRLGVSQARLSRVKKDAGTIRQGHLQKAAAETSLAPKKAKTLTRQMIEQFYAQLPEQWLTNGKIDRVTKEAYPSEILEVMVATANAILSGQSDPGAVIRGIMVQRGEWVLPEDFTEETHDLLDVPPGDEEIEDE